MEDISEVIPREFLNCRLCNEEFQDPKLLPCLHSFCRACLSSYMKQQRRDPSRPHTNDDDGDNDKEGEKKKKKGDGGKAEEEEEVRFSCPECGTAVGAKDPGYLPDNVLARRLSCPSLASTPRDPANCAPCGQQGRGEVAAAVHCANCEENLCASCASSHDEQVETASHKVEPLTAGGRDPDSSKENGGGGGAGGATGGVRGSDSGDNLSGVLSKCCQCYDTYDIDSMYCVDCDRALCADCHASHDQRHRCAELSAIAQNFTSKIKEPVEDLRRDSQTLSRMLANLDRAERYAGKLQRDVSSRSFCQIYRSST